MASKKRKPSLQFIANKHGISRQTLYSYKEKGIDVYNDSEIEKHRANLSNGIPKAKRPPKNVKWQSSEDAQEELAFDFTGDIYAQIDKACDYETARFLKMKSDAKIQAHKYEVEIGNYTKNSDIKENILRIGSAIKAALLRYESDLPPMTAGLTESKIQKIIRAKNNEILGMFSSLSKELYKDE
jgi:hypothetical protein